MGLFTGHWYEVMPFDGWDSFVKLDFEYMSSLTDADSSLMVLTR